jgi:hypothetical protein
MILFVSLTSYGQDCDSLPELNSSVVEFAKGKVGKKVDRGECWDLIKYALDDVDAEWDGFENFGDIVDETTECLYPGDIIQFKKIKIRYKEGDMTYTESMYHHTAIILEVSNDNNDLVILHQNSAQHGRKVGESDLKIDTVVSGTLTFYRPTSKDLD